MKKIIILVLFSSCIHKNGPEVVFKIQYNGERKCRYFIHKEGTGGIQDYSFLDSCGKFNIQDTIIYSKP